MCVYVCKHMYSARIGHISVRFKYICFYKVVKEAKLLYKLTNTS